MQCYSSVDMNQYFKVVSLLNCCRASDVARPRQNVRHSYGLGKSMPRLRRWDENVFCTDEIYEFYRTLLVVWLEAQPAYKMSASTVPARAGSRVVRIDPLCFLAYKATKPGLVLFYILACFNWIVAYQGPFYVLLILVGICFVFWLF